MSEFYSRADEFDYHIVASELNQNLLDGHHLLQEAAILAARPRDVVVEFSCGGALFAPYYRHRGAFYFGFDINVARTHRSTAPRAVGSAYAAPFASGCADLVISFYALEHVSWPALYLREMMRVAKPGGSLVLVFPDYVDRAGPQLPSVRWGRSYGGVRDKLARRAFTDAVQTYLEQRVVYRWRLSRLRRQIFRERRTRFMIQLSPSCLIAPWSIDTDAIYLASEEEVALYLSKNGCRVEQRSADLRDPLGKKLEGKYQGHAFILARRLT